MARKEQQQEGGTIGRCKQARGSPTNARKKKKGYCYFQTVKKKSMEVAAAAAVAAKLGSRMDR